MRGQFAKHKIILDLCGGTGAWAKPYKDAGYKVITITLPHFDILKTELTDDSFIFKGRTSVVCRVKKSAIYGILAAPPCTMFSFARTRAKQPRDLPGAMALVKACLLIIWHCQLSGVRLAFWALENPKARLRWFLGKPALTFNPYDYGDTYRKPTDLWGNFNTNLKQSPVTLTNQQQEQARQCSQKLQVIPKCYVRDSTMSSKAIARSITHPGFAKAFYEANR